uniref:Uncharacterized protein n=1 Tax=Nelumbo nucifera TaxID=4432 RepID=A0A822Z4S6_NELNU|nr:TPA_asm: hypothetical protein HUJ06_013013 [Nelumbo nucifera]
MSCVDPNSNSKPIVIREVWSDNLEAEFELIQGVIDQYPFTSMDTEFPSRNVNFYHRKPFDHYLVLKANMDYLNLTRKASQSFFDVQIVHRVIEVGLTFSDTDGNLPDLGTGNRYIWMDFEKNKEKGINSSRFTELMMSSGLICNDLVSWVTFNSTYDFGYLVKILTSRSLLKELGREDDADLETGVQSLDSIGAKRMRCCSQQLRYRY